VYCSREHTPYARRRDTAVEQALRADGRALHALPGSYLSDFDEIRNTAGDPFRVYSPFARAAKAAAWDDPLPAPTRVPVPDELAPAGTALDGFDLDGAVEVTPPDPAAALARLRWFVERRVDGYARARNSMATDGTSRLSPYLRFGLVSPRQVAAAVTGQGPRSGGGGGRETFVNELLWRDFYAYLLYHRPELAWFELEDDREGLAAWQEGRTGYPLVDAGMRQLSGQGWVHNRARMVVASFLTKHLLVDWREDPQPRPLPIPGGECPPPLSGRTGCPQSRRTRRRGRTRALDCLASRPPSGHPGPTSVGGRYDRSQVRH
jgi:deoxyribodipyrimidine photo-lyase